MQAARKGSGERDEGLWRLAIIVDVAKLETRFTDIDSNPMRLLAWFTPPLPSGQGEDGTALAMCKLSVFDTFDNVHEYQAKKGVQLRAASHAQCRYPHVTMAAYLCMGTARETVLMNFDSQSLSRNTGLSQPATPTILVASEAFLVSHGYAHMEQVWVCLQSPLPLERVIVSGGQRATPLTPSLVLPVIQQLATLVAHETVIFRQDTPFFLPGPFVLTGSEEERRHGTVEMCVLECSPVLQGQLTSETEVVVLPREETSEEEEGEGGEGEGSESSPSLNTRSKSRQSLSMSFTSSGEAGMEESWETKSRSASVVSNCSASDFRNEEEMNSDPTLEVASHAHIKLHRHYVIVPKSFALDHELFQYQGVLLVADRYSPRTGLADLVLSTRARGEGLHGTGGSHAAILLWFDGQAELERYLPPPYPGYLFEDEALQCAYVHPHLLYTLFPETLSPSRRYRISLKVRSHRTHTHSLTLSHTHTHTE